MWWHTRRGLPGRGQDGTSAGASALHKSRGGRARLRGAVGGQPGRGCSAVPSLQGDVHEKRRSCPCLSFPPGKGQLDYLMQRETES